MDLATEINERANEVRDQLAEAIKPAHTEKRALSTDESAIVERLEEQLAGLERQHEIAVKTQKRQAEHTEGAKPVVHSATQDEVAQHRTAGEENVYHPGNANLNPRDGGRSFLNDVLLSRSGDVSEEVNAARERLIAHRRQMQYRGLSFHPGDTPPEQRDQTTALMKGLVPPQYIFADAAPAIRRARPTADAMNNRPMPQTGMTLTIPRVTGTGSTASIVAENTAASETDAAVTDLNIPVKILNGAIDLSFAAIDRGVMVDDLLMLDLRLAVEEQVNLQVVGKPSPATNDIDGLLSTATNRVTIAAANYKQDADGTASAALTYQHIVGDVLTKLATTRYQRATHLIMHPRRLGYLASAADTQGRPLWQSLSLTASNVVAHGDQGGAVNETSVMLAGVPVISDPAIPADIDTSDEDAVIGFYSPEMLLYESPMMVFSGNPALHKWTHTITMGKYVAFAPKYDTSAAAVRGTIFAAT